MNRKITERQQMSNQSLSNPKVAGNWKLKGIFEKATQKRKEHEGGGGGEGSGGEHVHGQTTKHSRLDK